MADLEKEMAFVFCKIDMCIVSGGAGQFFNFIHGLLRDKHFYFAVQSCEFVIGLSKCKAVAVCRYHRERVRFQN